MSAEFTSYLQSKGIEHDTTLPGSPQQNGRAERWNRTIMEKALCLLHHAGLTHGFWWLAVSCAVHLYNRQPLRRLKWRCPITALNGTVPDVSYFRVFGCKAYVHVQKDNRHGKLDEKAIDMTFVGYEEGSKGYKFWNPQTRKIIVSRDVIFDESVFPAQDKNTGRRATPRDNPFPIPPSEDDPSNGESDDIPLPIPLEWEDNPQEEGQPAAPQPQPAAPPHEDPLPMPPQPVPRPEHQRAPAPPPPPPARPRREGAGRNPHRNRDNVYGDEPPAQIDARTRTDGSQQDLEREAAEVLYWIAYSRYKSGIPDQHKDAMRRPEADKWKAAEQAEMDSLLKNHTWDLVELPAGRTAIKNRWVYDMKQDGRFKARLVVKGFTQQHGIDFDKTFSPTARYESMRYLLAHAALEDWEIDSMDVKTAFLNG